MSWTQEEWAAAASSPDWSAKVAKALVRYFEEKWEALFAQAKLISVSTETDSDGAPVLRAIYDHPHWPERTGLRRRLDRVPFAAQDEETPEGSTAATIAIYDISEPLGTLYEKLVPDEEGVWWWGDGYGVGEGL